MLTKFFRHCIALSMLRQAKTTPVALTDVEMGLMTSAEFLAVRNPKGKWHPSEAYDFSVAQLNYRGTAIDSQYRGSSGDIKVVAWEEGYGFFVNDSPVAILHGNTLYHTKKMSPYELKRALWNHANETHKKKSEDEFTIRVVKYLSEYMPLVNNVAKRNALAFPVVVQRVRVKEEFLVVRAEATLQKNKGQTLVITNEEGLVVAQASDEWGTTLLAVAREYRGKGLGKILGKFWYAWNPAYPSGGFTSAGERNAIGLWEQRVREFLANGWYSELLRKGEITKQRLQAILAGLGKRVPKEISKPKSSPDSKDVLVFIEEETTFIVYNKAFLEEPDEKHIHGFGFFRDSHPVGMFLYAIDYEPAYRKLTTMVALQMARNMRTKLYVGEGYGDIVELSGIAHVEQEGDYIQLTQNVLNISALAKEEQKVRRVIDKYDEKKMLLLEMAHSKW
jgi:GNAT superfamily N-acetyltransferase